MEKTSKVILFFLVLVFLTGLFTSKVAASEMGVCPNRYAVLVNPVRGRDLWSDKSLSPLKDQYAVSQSYGMPVTWLFQYDALMDGEIYGISKDFSQGHEIGIFLEVSPKLARDTNVIYPTHLPWASPSAVFLSGYSPSDRKKLIDKIFYEYKKRYLTFPSSVGAWWIDSYSLNYMVTKYGVSTALIVADQKTTDNYGVWGQWWGAPYYPSKANILTPASNLENKEDVVVIQWAQRDLTKAYGEGYIISNFSLQANDYGSKNLTTDYFKSLVETYLACGNNKLSAVTVGLETGMESSGFISEYKNQLRTLSEMKKVLPTTMKDFSTSFRKVYPGIVDGYTFSDSFSTWRNTVSSRENDYLGEFTRYENEVSFSDYFIQDKATFLKRYIPLDNKPGSSSYIWLIISAIGILVYLLRFFGFFTSLIWLLSALSAYGLILRSFEKFGWKVFFGPEFNNIYLTNTLLLLTTFLITLKILKHITKKNYLYYFPLVFGFDPVLRLLRYTNIAGEHWLGISLNPLSFIGVGISGGGIRYIDNHMSFEVASAILKVNFERFGENQIFSLILYPVIHLLMALILFSLLKNRPQKFRNIIIAILSVLMIINIVQIFLLDPVSVVPLV